MAVGSVLGGIGAIAGAGAGIAGMFGGGGGGGGDPGDAAIKAAQYQQAGTLAAIQNYRDMYDQTRNDLAPWRGAGTSAVNQYAGLLNLPGYTAVNPTEYLRSTPGYQWQLDQGINALDRSAAAKGMLMSGPQSKSVLKYGQGLADTTYNSLMDRLYNLSGQGLNAAAQTGTAAMQTSGRIGDATMAGANAQGAGLVNAYNARQSAYGNQQNNLWGGLGALTRGITQAAPYLSNWWGGNSGYSPQSYGSSNYYSSGMTPAGYAENYYT